jgi:hypothetical protein
MGLSLPARSSDSGNCSEWWHKQRPIGHVGPVSHRNDDIHRAAICGVKGARSVKKRLKAQAWALYENAWEITWRAHHLIFHRGWPWFGTDVLWPAKVGFCVYECDALWARRHEEFFLFFCFFRHHFFLKKNGKSLFLLILQFISRFIIINNLLI